MIQLDLHGVVPEPPDELLDWSELDRRIHRRRLNTQIAATVGAAAVVAATVAVGISVIGGTSSSAPLGPTSHDDGGIIFGQDTTAVTRTNGFADTSLYSADPQGTGIERLTRQADGINEAAASPDGRRIAYSQVTYGRGPAGHPTHVNGEYVHIADANGSNDRRVFQCPSSWCGDLEWSPDSRRVLIRGTWVAQPDGQVTRVCVGECTPRNYTSEASWSADGTRLAFQYWKAVPLENGERGAAGTATVQAIGVMDADGSDPQLITDVDCSPHRIDTTCTSDTNPVWSPDGSVIAFTRRPLTYLLPNASMGGPGLGFGPAVIMTVRPDGSRSRQVLDCGSYCSIRSLSWSPSGGLLAFVSEDMRGLRGKPPWALNIIDPRTGDSNARPLSFLTDNDMPDYVWAPSGGHIAIGSRAGDGTRAPGIYLVPIRDGRPGTPRLLTPTGLPPLAWLPRAPTNRAMR